jgi:lysozyme
VNRDSVFEQLKVDEGVVYGIYLDHLDYPTFGIGHLIKDDDPEFGQRVGTPVSVNRVEQCFMQDLDTAISECKILYDAWEDWPGEVQEILVNMMFNMGRPRLSKFKNMAAALNQKDWVTAAEEGRDSLWYAQVHYRAERLMGRLEKV